MELLFSLITFCFQLGFWYILEKALLRPLFNDKIKKFTISYNIDKYVFKLKDLSVDSYFYK
jgi:hypothetical protein